MPLSHLERISHLLMMNYTPNALESNGRSLNVDV